MSALALSFNDTQFDVIDRNQQPWLRGTQIGDALGYKKAGRISIDKLYKANADEFTDSMTALVKLPDLSPQSGDAGQIREVRVFSLRGCHLLAMFARTAIAKEFRKWVLDILEKQTQTRNGLVELSEPLTITKAQAGELFTMVANKARSSGKPNAYFWCRFQNHFKLSSYKDTPAHQFDEAKDYLRRLEGEDTDQFRMLTPQELAAIIQQNTPSRTTPQSSLKTDDHIVLPLYQNGLVKRLTVKLDHQHQAGHYQNARWFVSRSDDQLTVEQLDHNELLMSEQKFIHYLTHECGYIVVKKTEVASKLMA